MGGLWRAVEEVLMSTFDETRWLYAGCKNTQCVH